MSEFLNAALPWVALGMAVAVFAAYFSAGRKDADENNK